MRSHSLVANEPLSGDIAFFFGPVVDADGAVLTVLIVAVDGSRGISPILQEGSFWDTYAFDASGRLLSQSLWLADLQRAGLLPEGEDVWVQSPVYARDPGGNLLRGHRTNVPPASLPLTRMAASAVLGESGMDLDGYRNMIGVEVVGAWTWIPEYDIGIATELPRAEIRKLLRPLYLSFARARGRPGPLGRGRAGALYGTATRPQQAGDLSAR